MLCHILLSNLLQQPIFSFSVWLSSFIYIEYFTHLLFIPKKYKNANVVLIVYFHRNNRMNRIGIHKQRPIRTKVTSLADQIK